MYGISDCIVLLLNLDKDDLSFVLATQCSPSSHMCKMLDVSISVLGTAYIQSHDCCNNSDYALLNVKSLYNHPLPMAAGARELIVGLVNTQVNRSARLN